MVEHAVPASAKLIAVYMGAQKWELVHRSARPNGDRFDKRILFVLMLDALFDCLCSLASECKGKRTTRMNAEFRVIDRCFSKDIDFKLISEVASSIRDTGSLMRI